MSTYTCQQLQQEIGSSISLIPYDNDTKAHIKRPNGASLALIDFEQGRIEARLTVTWNKMALAGLPGRKPDAATIASARQELREEVLYDWDLAGFTIPDEGKLEQIPDPDHKNRKTMAYVVVATKSVPTRSDAAQALQAIDKFCNWITIKA